MQRFLLTITFLLFQVTLWSQTADIKVKTALNKQVLFQQLMTSDTGFTNVTSHISATTKTEHIYFLQAHNYLPILGTQSSIHIASDGAIIKQNINFTHNTAKKISANPTPQLSPNQVLTMVAGQLEVQETAERQINALSANQFKVIAPELSKDEINMQLAYALAADGSIRLVWDFNFPLLNTANWWHFIIDSNSGEILVKNDMVINCTINHDHNDDLINYNKNLQPLADAPEEVLSGAGCVGCYEVFAIPLENPFYGDRSLEVSPEDANASPFGWHDSDGVAGAEFTVTRGNNVNAYEDGDNPGYQPDGGANLNFSGVGFEWSIMHTTDNQSEAASITNLFYWNNIVHDILANYGFDEAAGNFQELNYSGLGIGGDSVNAESQDGSDTCNANFATPAEGNNPRMQMFLCDGYDSSFDNFVVIHEYAHGLSNRLVGGPLNSGCLNNIEQMGEGWSDYLGLILTMQPGDAANDARGVGTFLIGESADGPGIRSWPYSRDLGINPRTYSYINSISVHRIGSVWASMLWDMTWNMIDQHGWDPNINSFTGDASTDAGNVMALAIVVEAMKLMPCSPGFVDARDAIFAADLALYDGINECLIWDAFARRGLGINAEQGSPFDPTDGVQSFVSPVGSAQINPISSICENAPVLTNQEGGSPFGGVYSGPGVTDDGNGSTFTFDPAAAGVGVHTITYLVEEANCTVASEASTTIEVFAQPAPPSVNDVTDACVGETSIITAVVSDSSDVIRWFTEESGGEALFEGAAFEFNPEAVTTLYVQQNPAEYVSQLVISELTFQVPDAFEIQNIGPEKNYSGYHVVISDQPYDDINTPNPNTRNVGLFLDNSVKAWSDGDLGNPWPGNIRWDSDPEDSGWILIMDPEGNVVDSVFWNVTEEQVASFNITVDGFTITAADLDWTGAGIQLTGVCFGSYRRHGDSNSAADWAAGCENSDFTVYNRDIELGVIACIPDRVPARIETQFECLEEITVSIEPEETYIIPDYKSAMRDANICANLADVTQEPEQGQEVSLGSYEIVLETIDMNGFARECTFTLKVEDATARPQTAADILLFPNPTSSTFVITGSEEVQVNQAVIADITGKVILNNLFDITDQDQELDVSQLATGVYFVRIFTNRGSTIRRLVKN